MRTEAELLAEIEAMAKSLAAAPVQLAGYVAFTVTVLGWVLGQHDMAPTEAFEKLEEEINNETDTRSSGRNGNGIDDGGSGDVAAGTDASS
jgi:hypothetical protein